MREKAREYEAGKIDREEYDFEDMMQRNRLSNVAFIMQSAVEIVVLAILVGILKAINPEASDANNLWSLSVTIAYATAIVSALSPPIQPEFGGIQRRMASLGNLSARDQSFWPLDGLFVC